MTHNAPVQVRTFCPFRPRADTPKPAARRTGSDFIYAAERRFGPGGDAHLQFRISDEGRYGVSVVELASASTTTVEPVLAAAPQRRPA